MGARSRVELAVVAFAAAAVTGYAVSEDSTVDELCYLGVLVVASVIAWWGVLRAPAEHRVVSGLLASGVTLTAVGDVVWAVLGRYGADQDVSVADVPWAASYVVLCAALWIVFRRSTGGTRDPLTPILDGITIAVVSFLVFWSLSIEAIVADDSLANHVKVVWAAYPVADAVLLALVVRVLTDRRSRAALDPSFAVGACIWLASDIAYLQAPGGAAEIVMDTGWMIAPLLVARSVWRLRPLPAAPDGGSAPENRVAQLAVAIGPLLVPPALEVVADLRDRPDRPLMLMVGATLLTVLAFVRMARLIRSEERALRELEGARDAALAASRAKSMFLATMSHEIRTPLTMVLGAGELLEDTTLDEEQLHLVKRMRRSGGLLRALVEGVLDFSRIEAGQLELDHRPFDLHGLVDDLAEVYRPRATQAGVGFACEVHPGVRRAVVGDPDRLLQVLSNLLDNALKFTHEGQVRLDVRPAPDGGGVDLAVADTGIGIPPEDLSSVFESFRQVDGSTTRRYGGTGLGLAICRQLVELMGGSLTVTSEMGAGSIFVARVPLADPPSTHPGEPEAGRVRATAPGTLG